MKWVSEKSFVSKRATFHSFHFILAFSSSMGHVERHPPRVVGLEKHDADNVVAHVPLPLQLLRIVLLVGEEGGHVEHDLDAPPVGVHRVQAG